ncbi:MAG: acyltransferase family protein, partial [Myxococcales bacterium]|nr:acyltransferase family protein [Myxococcales bacterium]
MATSFIDLIEEYANNFIDDDTKKRVEQIAARQTNEFGVDQFGLDARTLRAVVPILCWFYHHYFRVETFGAQHIPKGRMMVIANHSGQLPFDGAMIAAAFLLEAKEPRLLRGMVERWTSEIPFVSTLLPRLGQVVGSPSTCKTLLENEEGVIVFPEGVKGISKLFSERYQLTSFGTGFMRIALAAKAPVVPVALIGAEEQAPAVANLAPLAKTLGIPALPIIFPQLVPLPLPVKYRIYIGEPIYFNGDGTEDDDDIAVMVKSVKDTVQQMIKN